jgi:hypothetical protein
VDAGVALADMLSLGARYGSAAKPLGKDAINVLRRSVQRARVELLSGHADRLLRRLNLEIDFGPAASGTLAQAFGQATGTHLTIELAIDQPNQPLPTSAR